MNRRKVLSGMGMAVAATAFGGTVAAKSEAQWKDWPKGSSPAEIGKRVADRFGGDLHPQCHDSRCQRYGHYHLAHNSAPEH